MPNPNTASYGSWKSPITSDLIVADMIGLGGATFINGTLYWTEMRPKENGRIVIVRRTSDGVTQDINPQPFNARTRVHEYGGRAHLVVGDTIFYSNFADQRLYRQVGSEQPEPITPAVDLRYADPIYDARRARLICVREDHTIKDQEVTNTIVSLDPKKIDEGWVLASGYNFYSNPRLSPDGEWLAWLSWNHPNLPWDGTELWVAQVATDGSLGAPFLIAGGLSESIFQPEWSPDGRLYFVSDRTGWWNLYRWQDGQIEAIFPMQAEFGLPQWVFGTRTYAFESAERLVCIYFQGGSWHLAELDTITLQLREIKTPYTQFWSIDATAGQVTFIAGSPTEAPCLIHLDLQRVDLMKSNPVESFGAGEILRRSSSVTVDPGYISIAQEIEFPTENGLTAYAYYYPPRNQDFQAPVGEKPPLLVLSHGGPTGSTSPVFSLSTQYWTSRGFAVVDVNYGGSTGYGREYRQRLNGNWGIVDVNDCANSARYLVENNLVDGYKLAIRGGSAGGYTTLAALTFTDVFKAGASHFGISDLEIFAGDTHKFESRYLDTLVGPYPERKDLYIQRSPIHFTDRLNCPMILFQGLEDKIVPPSQSEMMYQAVKAKGLPIAYLAFEGEQHGFRKAENIKRTLDAELYFYSRVFNFELIEPIEPVKIENLE